MGRNFRMNLPCNYEMLLRELGIIMEILPVVKGVATAFIMTVALGPGMLLNIHRSLHGGFTAGLCVVAGLYTSDAAFIAVNYFGVSPFFKSLHHQGIAGIVCGAAVCIAGICMAVKKSLGINAATCAEKVPKAIHPLKQFLSGFAVNSFNPFVFIFWMTLMSIATLNFGFRTPQFFEYFAGVFITALFLDIIKSYLFSRIQTGLNAKVVAGISRGIGTAVASAGIAIMYRSIIIFGQPTHP
jgi:threonine/homoserine/homoserine lactone efflux protein